METYIKSIESHLAQVEVKVLLVLVFVTHNLITIGGHCFSIVLPVSDYNLGNSYLLFNVACTM